jgi:DNA-binding NarL/FixJ family response regulator
MGEAPDRSPLPEEPAHSAAASGPASAQREIHICLVGAARILRHALRGFLEAHGVRVPSALRDEEALADMIEAKPATPPDLIVLVLPAGAFRTFHRIREILARAGARIPLVVLSERASRGQVYAALRAGAKAYVDLDAEPEELLRALRMAADGKVHLSPDAAQLLVDDITTAAEPVGAPRPPGVDLSRRELEVVQLLCEGLSSKQIGHRLQIAPKTVENHRYNIYRKCEVDGIASLMRHAIQHGLISI